MSDLLGIPGAVSLNVWVVYMINAQNWKLGRCVPFPVGIVIFTYMLIPEGKA